MLLISPLCVLVRLSVKRQTSLHVKYYQVSIPPQNSHPPSTEQQRLDHVPTLRYRSNKRPSIKASTYREQLASSHCHPAKGQSSPPSYYVANADPFVQASNQIEEQSQAEIHRPSKAGACDESVDEDLEAMRDIALKKAASLEALQAYGGCFVSGFMAMQDPLPWLSPTASPSPSSSSRWSFGSPRPDSDTLSRMDIEELSSEPKKSWRSMKRLRGAARRSRS